MKTKQTVYFPVPTQGAMGHEAKVFMRGLQMCPEIDIDEEIRHIFVKHEIKANPALGRGSETVPMYVDYFMVSFTLPEKYYNGSAPEEFFVCREGYLYKVEKMVEYIPPPEED